MNPCLDHAQQDCPVCSGEAPPPATVANFRAGVRTSFRPEEFVAVPAGTPSAVCRSPRCGARIFWAKRGRHGKMHPIDCDVTGGEPPSSVPFDPNQIGLFADPELVEKPHDGMGVSHFDTCPDAGRFRTAIQD